MQTKRLWIGCLLALALGFAPAVYGQQFSDWSAAENLGPTVNSALVEVDPFISKDGLSLYFSCNNCPGGYGGYDIWVAQRASVNDPWGAPQNLGPSINTSAGETGAQISPDGHRLYFSSNRAGGFGSGDLYVSRRHNKRDDLGWQPAENLGSGVNTVADEAAPAIFEDDVTGVITLYFNSVRPTGLGDTDIYASVLQLDETFGPGVLVEELSSSAADGNVTIRRDGLELYLNSNRPGSILNLKGLPSVDIWVSTRASTSDPWSTPVNVDPLGDSRINSQRHEGSPALSFDGTELYFHAAQRTDNVGSACLDPTIPAFASCFFDLWVATRTKLQAPE
jgi:hypothetical protein